MSITDPLNILACSIMNKIVISSKNDSKYAKTASKQNFILQIWVSYAEMMKSSKKGVVY